jgi:hypothetical protein
MAGTIQIDLSNSGITVYALIWNQDGQFWNGTAFETYTTANYLNYDIPMTELGTASGIYSVAFPTAIPTGLYYVSIRRQIGGATDETDRNVGFGSYVWNALDDSFVFLDPVEQDIRIEGNVNDATPAAGTFDGDAALSTTDDFYNGSVLCFRDGTLVGIARRISDYVGSTRTFTFDDPFPVAPADQDNFIIIGRIDQ